MKYELTPLKRTNKGGFNHLTNTVISKRVIPVFNTGCWNEEMICFLLAVCRHYLHSDSHERWWNCSPEEIATREKAILWNGTGKYSFELQMTQLSQQMTFQCVMTSRVHLKSDSLDTSISSYHRNKLDRKENTVFKGGVYLISSNGKFVPRSLKYRGRPSLESRDKPIFWLLL